jgi:hypothetical protein
VAKIKTRKMVELSAVDKRLTQMGLTPGMVGRMDVATGELELETADPSISNADLQRIVTDLPEHKPADPAEVAARRDARRGEAKALADKATWNAKDTEAALRLLLAVELDRS